MVAIKDMKMPSCCKVCDFRKSDPFSGEVYCNKAVGSNAIIYEDEKLENCPLIEIEERKVGKWQVKDNGNGGIYVECPFCGALAPSTEFTDRTVWKYSKFCYDCGNELRGSENE